jgi:hypothetical protein
MSEQYPEQGRRAQATHLILVRAADEDTEGAHAQFTIGYAKEPTPETLAEYCAQVEAAFEAAHGRTPDRIGVAVLPWVADLDEDDA